MDLTAELVPTDQSPPVFATEGGRRYHKTRACFALIDGQSLWVFDPQQWVPGMPQIMLSNGHPRHEMTVTDALGKGKEPCAECFPGQRAALHRSSSENDYGHEPFEFGGETVCARCLVRTVRVWIDEHDSPHRLWGIKPVAWPCTSAVVLGLVPRTVEQDAALRKAVWGCETPETHNAGCPCTPAP
jgi:hypothetical protein